LRVQEKSKSGRRRTAPTAGGRAPWKHWPIMSATSPPPQRGFHDKLYTDQGKIFTRFHILGTRSAPPGGEPEFP